MNMNIVFTDQYDKESRNKFGIPRELVREAIQNPLNYEEIKYDGLTLLFITKEIDNEYMLLIIGNKNIDNISVDLAFRVKKDLDKTLKIQNPSSILKKLIEKCGLFIEIGNISQKLFIAQDIDIKAGQNINLFDVKNPDNHSFVSSVYIKINEDRSKLGCALLFAFDTEKYLDWVSN